MSGVGVANSGAGYEFQPGEVQMFYMCVCFRQYRLVKEGVRGVGVASSGAGHEFQPGEVQIFYICVCVCVCRERERERERWRRWEGGCVWCGCGELGSGACGLSGRGV